MCVKVVYLRKYLKEVLVQPRVISYRRYSSIRQGRGHSLARQTKAAEEWCREKGWVLDTSLRPDLGVSAFSGRNLDPESALGGLMEALKVGDIEPGTYLLVEALDRLSRQDLLESVPLLMRLVKAGLIVVTLTDKKEWSRENLKKMEDFMYSVMLFSRAHEESSQKGKRVRERFEAGRSLLSRREFGSAPGWLQRESKEHPWIVIEERAEAVRKVFELSAQGYGTKAIAQIANSENWPIPTRDTLSKPPIWHATMAGRLLRMREVTGEREYRYTSHEAKQRAKHWKGEASGIVVPDYYPRIVSDELWHRARASIDRRMTKPRRRDEHYMNIWSGLLRCGYCGASIQRKTETRGSSRAQLICSNKLAGVTSCKTGSASKTDEPLLLDICAMAGDQMGLGYDKNKAARAIDVAKSKLNDNSKSSQNIADAISALGAMPELLKKARELRDVRAALEAEVQRNSELMASDPGSLLDTTYAENVLKHLYERSEEARAVRADCNARLSRAVVGIWHFAYDVAIVQFRNNQLMHVPLREKTKGAEHPKALELAIAADENRISLPGLQLVPQEFESIEES